MQSNIVEEKSAQAVKELKDSNGEYKERASLTEIAGCWAVESGRAPEEIKRALVNEVRNGGFEYKFPKGTYSDIESATVNGCVISPMDLQDYLRVSYSYIREKLINDYCQKVEPSPIDYASALSNLTTETITLHFDGVLQTNIKEQGLQIFPEYAYSLSPLQEPELNSTAPFWEWYNALTIKQKQYIQDYCHLGTSNSKINIVMPRSALLSFMRISLIYGVELDMFICRLQNDLRYEENPVNIIIEGTTTRLQDFIKAFCEKYADEQRFFNWALADHIYLTRKSFLRWLRMAFPREPLLPSGTPEFWGDLFDNQPESYNDEDDGTEAGYKLYDAIRFWIDPSHIALLEMVYSNVTAFRTPQNRNFNYLPLEDTSDIRAVTYNTQLKKIHAIFLGHFKQGRLEMRGFISNPSERELVHPETIEGMIDSNLLNFLASRGRSGNAEMTGIRVFKTTKNKASHDTIDLSGEPQKESKVSARRTKVEALIPKFISECLKQKIFPQNKERFAARLHEFAAAKGEWKKTDYDASTILRDLSDIGWKDNIKPLLDKAKNSSRK